MRNVVLFTIDALRRDVLSLYGCSDGLTPFLDSLAEDSVVFTRAHSVAPYTQASFPGILTSSYLFDTPRAPKLSEKRLLISEALKNKAVAQGITTAAFHSNPYLSGYFGWNRGWDQFYDSMEEEVEDMSPYIKGAMINQKVDAWLGSVDRSKPLFLWVHYMDVHEPYVPERKYLERVDGSIRLNKEQMFALFTEVVLTRDASNRQTVQLLKKLYQAHVCEVDEYARQLFQILEKHKLLQDSAVIVSTDHGEEFGEHGGLSHDGKMYSELVHVPQLIFNPPESRGESCDTLVSGLDISPTVLYLFGLKPEGRFQGRSLFPLSDYPEKGVYGEAVGKLAHKVKETDKPAYYYREGHLKVIYRQEEDGWELYDLEKDPQEKDSLIDGAAEAQRMIQALKPRINREYL
jgi:arylsulfatase A-like enzyme